MKKPRQSLRRRNEDLKVNILPSTKIMPFASWVGTKSGNVSRNTFIRRSFVVSRLASFSRNVAARQGGTDRLARAVLDLVLDNDID